MDDDQFRHATRARHFALVLGPTLCILMACYAAQFSLPTQRVSSGCTGLDDGAAARALGT